MALNVLEIVDGFPGILALANHIAIFVVDFPPCVLENGTNLNFNWKSVMVVVFAQFLYGRRVAANNMDAGIFFLRNLNFDLGGLEMRFSDCFEFVWEVV